MKKVFIDGQAGTTGLKIREMLKNHNEVEIVEIEEKFRKDIGKKRELFNEVDLVVLCLPDEAAVEAVKEIPQNTKVIDTSSAHRTAKGWVYGFPELKNMIGATPDDIEKFEAMNDNIFNETQREKIRTATRVSNPGCHSTGAIAALRPLVSEGVVGGSYPILITSLTGYSGGGRQMIEGYKQRDKNDNSWAVRPYALALKHKHLPEITAMAGLKYQPLFYPVLGDVEQGMLVSMGFENRLLKRNLDAQGIHDILKKYYQGEKFVRVLPFNDNSILADGLLPNAYLTATNCNGTNNLDIMVFGNETQTLVISRLDNLGKGASGAAVQNLNIMLGFDESTGL